MSQIEYESDIAVVAVNDGAKDYLFRLSKLAPCCNAVQLKKMEAQEGSRRIIDLGIQTNTVDKPRFMSRADELGLTVELRHL